MTDRFNRATATKAFKCEDCQETLPQGSDFFWDNERKVGPRQYSARVCELCRDNYNKSETTQGSTPSKSVFAAAKGQSQASSGLGGLDKLVAILENQNALLWEIKCTIDATSERTVKAEDEINYVNLKLDKIADKLGLTSKSIAPGNDLDKLFNDPTEIPY